jgi:Tfp pilus assembly protein PilF
MAQRHNLTINAETPEGAKLQAIGTESDAAKKATLMEEFLKAHPKHEGAAWVAEQLVTASLAAGNVPKAAAAAQQLIEIDPDEVEAPLGVLKAHERLKDAAGALKWSELTSKAARRALAAPKPNGEEEAKSWQANQEYAKQVEQYAEYALLNQVTLGAPPDEAMTLVAALERRNPKSPYLLQASNALFSALRQSAPDKAVAFAEQALVRDPANEEMLLVTADYYMQKNDREKTLSFATKLVEVMNAKAKPEQLSDSDWTARRNTLLGAGNWMAGVTLATQEKFAPADKSLRDALPLLSDEQMKAAALFHLGVANFRLGEAANSVPRVQEGYRYSLQCAAIASPYKANCQKNASGMQTKYRFPAPAGAKPAAKKKK